MLTLRLPLATALAACLIPTPVFAHAGVAISSSAVMELRVYIPPIADSLRAAETGANGIWTVKGEHGGLMIALDSEGTAESRVTIYSRESAAFNVFWDSADMRQAGTADSGSLGQLAIKSFAVPKGPELVRTFTITPL
ncbi:hypothetical protein PF049_13120 [Erythrobacteraceae bacterium WH01K]|nr:hypothetical protein PF049_13120 [Erythrobacteraceae bacterium WH01K]